MDKLVNRMGLGVALLAIVLELTYLNAKSLLYLTGTDTVDKVFAVIGAFAFSVVTVVVMRKRTAGMIKMIFPWFDAALMFLGLNLKYADQLANWHNNPVQLGLTVFMALLAGISTYALGLINYREHETSLQSNSVGSESEFLKLKSELEKSESNLMAYKSNLDATEGKFRQSQSELRQLKSDYTKLQAQTADYKRAYLVAERGRILKKKPENRTETELATLAESEAI